MVNLTTFLFTEKIQDAKESQIVKQDLAIVKKKNALKLEELHQLEEIEAKLQQEVVSLDEYNVLIETFNNLQTKYDQLQKEEEEYIETDRLVMENLENYVSLATELERIDFNTDLEIVKKDKDLDCQIQNLEKENALCANEIKKVDRVCISLNKKIQKHKELISSNALKYEGIIKGLKADVAQFETEISDATTELDKYKMEKEMMEQQMKGIDENCAGIMKMRVLAEEAVKKRDDKILESNKELDSAKNEYLNALSRYK